MVSGYPNVRQLAHRRRPLSIAPKHPYAPTRRT